MNTLRTIAKNIVTRVWKAIGGAIGGLAGTQVDWVTNEIFGVDWPSNVDNAFAVILAFAGAYIFPKNTYAEKSTEGSVDTE